MFPVCETHIPPPVAGSPTNWGTDVTASFRVRLCVDETDDIFFVNSHAILLLLVVHESSV